MGKRMRFSVDPDRKSGKWEVNQQGRATPLSTHRTKEAAVDAGRKKARAEGPSSLYIRKENGRVQEERTYGGKDPFPPKG